MQLYWLLCARLHRGISPPMTGNGVDPAVRLPQPAA